MSYKVIKTCLKFSPVLIFMLFFQYVGAQTDSSILKNVLTKYEKSLGKNYTIVLNKDGKNVFLKETIDFKFKSAAPIGDCSKWLTTALTLIYVDEGKIKLDDPISKYIPLFEKYMKGYITIRNCLSQTSGIESEAQGVLKIVQKSKFETLEEEVNNYASKKAIVDNPGTYFTYGGIGPNIVARVLEIVTKKTFDKLALEKLFRPLGMKTASFYSEKGAINASYGAMVSAFDLNNFLQMIINNGMFNGKKILSENSIAEIKKNQFPDVKTRYSPEDMNNYDYAFGVWKKSSSDSKKILTLVSPSFTGSWIWIDFEKKYTGVILLENPSSFSKLDFFEEFQTAIQ
jgi:CubicO group peptidase (beta-lactamase class C family)